MAAGLECFFNCENPPFSLKLAFDNAMTFCYRNQLRMVYTSSPVKEVEPWVRSLLSLDMKIFIQVFRDSSDIIKASTHGPLPGRSDHDKIRTRTSNCEESTRYGHIIYDCGRPLPFFDID